MRALSTQNSWIQRLKIGLRSAFIGGLSLYALNGISPAEITDIELMAFPSHYEGQCPFKVIFTGYITVNKPETIIYHVHHSDLSWDSTMVELTFHKAGSYPVQSVQTVGSPGQNYLGYNNIEIVRGQSLVATPLAHFSLSCNPNRSFPQTITSNPQERFLAQLFSQARQEVQGLVSERSYQQHLILQQSSFQNDIVHGNVSQQQFYSSHGLLPYNTVNHSNVTQQTRISPYFQYPIGFPPAVTTRPVNPPANNNPPIETPSTPVAIPQTTIVPYVPPPSQVLPASTSNYQQFIQKNTTQTTPVINTQSSQIKITPYQTYVQQPSATSTQVQPSSSISYQQFLQNNSAGSMRITPYQQFIQGTPSLQPGSLTVPTTTK